MCIYDIYVITYISLVLPLLSPDTPSFPESLPLTPDPKVPTCRSVDHHAIWLVVQNMKVNGKDYPIYYGKSKMFETTTYKWNETVSYGPVNHL